MDKKMKIEIWSDVICPFCYIGKAKFDQALHEFVAAKDLEIEWKSYQIMPDLATQVGRSIDDVLVEKKRISLEQAKKLNGYATEMAKEVGLTYHFDRAIPANTLRAHQFQHFAKAHGRGAEAEELMFKAYFTAGKNVDDIDTLVQLGHEIGLDEEALRQALVDEKYLHAVHSDMQEAHQIGVNGVPFFVFDRKYAISGAQDPASFLSLLQKSYAEWKKQQDGDGLEIISGHVCTPDGTCD